MKPWIQTRNDKWVNTRNIVYIEVNGGILLHLNDGDVLRYSTADDGPESPEELIARIGGRPIPFEPKREQS